MSHVLSLSTERYYYRPVSGAAQFGARVYLRPSDPELRLTCARLADCMHMTIELERIQQLPSGARRYWLKRGDKWIPWRGDLPDAKTRRARPRWEP